MSEKKNPAQRILSAIVLIIVCFLSLFPLIWMFLGAFKSKTEVFAVPLKLLPEAWLVSNFTEVLQTQAPSFLGSLAITFLISASAVVLSLLINTMAGYVFARTEFYGKGFFWAYCIVTMFIPGLTIMLTSFLVVHRLGMLNTIWVLLIPGLTSGYNIFFFRQFYLNFPMALEDAARIDGAGRFRIYAQIFLPLSKAPLVVLGAGTFIGYWNSYLWPSLTVNDPRIVQVMQIIRSMRSVYSTNYGLVMAATSMAILPPLILFFIFQRYIIEGIVLSGVK